MYLSTKNLIAALVVCAAAVGAHEAPLTSDRDTPATASAAGSVLLECVVYRIDDAEIAAGIETSTPAGSNDAGGAMKALKAAETGVVRLARVHAPFRVNHEVTFSTSKKIPTVSVNQGQFSDQTSFSGWQQARSELSFKAAQDGEEFSTSFAIQVESFLEAGGNKGIPPPLDRVALHGSVSAASGTPRMYQLTAGSKDGSVYVVFVTVTAL